MLEDYKKERKKGLKEVQQLTQVGRLPYLRVLSAPTMHSKYIGTTSIPLDLIVGTENESRSNAFSYSFHPISEENSEFAHKWIRLYDTQVEQGIDEAIKVYEYKHLFYVREGNKRVSVFKALQAQSILANVTRILDDSCDSLLQAFYLFYERCPLYEMNFSKVEYFNEICEYTNHNTNEKWSDEDVSILKSRYHYFYSAYLTLNNHDSINPSDAFLMYVRVYSYSSLLSVDQDTLKKRIQSIYQEVSLLYQQDKQIYRTSSNVSKSPFSIKRKYYTHIHPLKIAFVYESYPNMKEWDLDHEMGRLYIQNIFGDKVETKAFSKEELGSIVGYDLVFSTSVFFMQETISQAIKHPETTYLNCSITTPSHAVSSYFGRMYEVKFLMGVLSAILLETDTIGYYIDETTHNSEINAFTCGVCMIKPYVKVQLTKNQEDYKNYDVFVGKDLPDDSEMPIFGLCKVKDGIVYNMATPIQNWGKYYEIIIRQFIQGSFTTQTSQSLQDIWGLDSEVIDILLSNRVSKETRELIHSLKESIILNHINIFAGLYDIEPSLDEILHMNDKHPNVLESK